MNKQRLKMSLRYRSNNTKEEKKKGGEERDKT